MGAQDNTEKVLRSLHVLLSKSEPYPKEPSKVIIDKQQVIDLLAELNTCIYQIMDEYELTIRSRDKAERDFHKKGDQIIWDASRKAEDIYAASVMYMDETLNRMQDIMQEADKKVGAIYQEIKEQMEKEEQELRTNKSELKGQLRKSLCKIFDCFFIQPCLFTIRTCHSLRTVITTHFSLNCLFYF